MGIPKNSLKISFIRDSKIKSDKSDIQYPKKEWHSWATVEGNEIKRISKVKKIMISKLGFQLLNLWQVERFFLISWNWWLAPKLRPNSYWTSFVLRRTTNSWGFLRGSHILFATHLFSAFISGRLMVDRVASLPGTWLSNVMIAERTRKKQHPGCTINVFPSLWPTCWGNPSYRVHQLRGNRASRSDTESKTWTGAIISIKEPGFGEFPLQPPPRIACPLKKSGEGLLPYSPCFSHHYLLCQSPECGGNPKSGFLMGILAFIPRTLMPVSIPEELKPKRRKRSCLVL